MEEFVRDILNKFGFKKTPPYCILNVTKYEYIQKHTVLHVIRSPQGLKESPSDRSSSLKINSAQRERKGRPYGQGRTRQLRLSPDSRTSMTT